MRGGANLQYPSPPINQNLPNHRTSRNGGASKVVQQEESGTIVSDPPERLGLNPGKPAEVASTVERMQALDHRAEGHHEAGMD
jgi:hypothetical protein